MALRLPKFQAGRPILEELTAEKLNQVVDAIRQCEINSGVGYDVTRGPGGTSLAIKQPTAVMPVELAGAKLIGPTSSGLSHLTNEDIAAGQGTYNFETRTESGDYQASRVHGPNFATSNAYNLANNCGAISGAFLQALNTVSIPTLAGKYAAIGLLSQYQGDVVNISSNTVTPCVDCVSAGDILPIGSIGPQPTINGVAIGGVGGSAFTEYFSSPPGIAVLGCGGTTVYGRNAGSGYRAVNFWTILGVFSAAGSFVRDNGALNPEPLIPVSNYYYKRTFDLGDINPSGASVKVRVRTSVNASTVLNAVLLNGQAVSFSYFETQTSNTYPILITAPMQKGTNTIEFVFNHNTANRHATASFEFLPTTALIVSKNGDGADDIGSLRDLTEAQADLVGLGTPVQAVEGGNQYIFSYSGTGDKRTSSSYERLREA